MHTKTVAFTPTANAAVTIGNRGDNVSPLNGDIAEVIVYNRALSQAERQRIEAYLSSKYSISVTATADTRNIYFVSASAAAHHQGDALILPVTALHTIRLTTVNSLPASGKIVLSFPGSGDSSASPSASTFAFNGLSPPNVQANGANCTFTVSAPSITCTLGSSVAAGTVVTILVGCSAQSGGSCTTSVPTLINPTKTAAAGSADVWRLTITTQDSNSVTIDSASVSVGTVEAVAVSGTVDPSLSMSIAGIANGTAINIGNTTGCTNTETASSGIASTATTVNLGSLGGGTVNIAAQLITVATNGINGYVLTATSSGHLIDPATGVFLRDSTTPTAMTAGTPWYGVHACGLDVSSATWGTGATGGGTGAKYGWPTQTTSVTLASDTTGPVGNAVAAGNGLVSVEYGATMDASIPAGTYTTLVTYVLTATF